MYLAKHRVSPGTRLRINYLSQQQAYLFVDIQRLVKRVVI